MRQKSYRHEASRWVRAALVWTTMLGMVACGGDVHFNPTQPKWPSDGDIDFDLGPRTLEISGDLIAQQGSCLEATLLYDGRELQGARVVCSLDGGCSRLHLKAKVSSETGHHTVSFKVLRQSDEAVSYRVQGKVIVTRQGLFSSQGNLLTMNIPLASAGSMLRAGDSVDFDLDFREE